MTVKSQTKRYSDLGWGINTYKSPSDIEDKESQVLINYSTQGNKIVNLPWYTGIYNFWTWAKKVVWLKDVGNYLYVIYDKVLYIRNKTTWADVTFNLTKFTNDWTLASRSYYNILVGKVADRFIIITDNDAKDDLYFLYFDWTTVTDKTSDTTWLTNKKFRTAWFYRWVVFLWGWELNPSALVNSWQSWPIDSDYILYFWTLPSPSTTTVGGQNIIGDDEPITWFITRQDVMYIMKTNSIWKITDIYADEATPSKPVVLWVKETWTWITGQWAVQNVLQDILYFDWNSVRRLSYEQNNLALKDVSISDEKISNVISSLPDNQRKAQSLFVYPYFKVFLRSDLSDENDVALVYNVIDKSWSIQKNIKVTVASSWYENKSVAYFWGIWWGRIFRDSDNASFDWWDIQWEWLSKSYSWWEDVDYKRVYEVEIYWKVSPWFLLTIDIYNWMNIIKSIEVLSNTNPTSTTWNSLIGTTTFGWIWENTPPMSEFKKRVDLYSDWREFSIGMRTSWIWNFEIHWINFLFNFINPYDIY